METSENSRIITTGHSGFALRHTWLKKACYLGDKGFLKENATIKLGVGKNMVQSIRFYANVCDIFAEEKGVDEHNLTLVDVISKEENDPYLDYAETIWLIHHKLVTNPCLVSYYEFFNSFNDTVFSNDRYREFLWQRIDSKGLDKMPADETIKRDVDCFISNYAVKTEEKPTDSFGALLRELNLIKTTEKSIHKRIYKKAIDVSDTIFIYALSQFWRANHYKDEAISLQAVSHDPKSPGRVFQMHEDEVHKKLRGISQSKANPVLISEAAGIINVNLETNVKHLVKNSIENLLKIYKKS